MASDMIRKRLLVDAAKRLKQQPVVVESKDIRVTEFSAFNGDLFQQGGVQSLAPLPATQGGESAVAFDLFQ